MARFSSRFAGAASLLAALSMTATPALATPIAPMAHKAVATGWDAASDNASKHRDWYGHRRHRGGIDAGDVIAGVLVIGGIAAIASAASKSKRDRDYREEYPDRDYRGDYRDRDYRSEDYRDGDRRYDYRGSDSGDDRLRGGPGLNEAVDSCVREVERREPVDEVDSARRDGDGWLIEGELRNGRDFACEVDGSGRVRDVDLDADFADSGSATDPHSGNAGASRDDDYYAAARRQHDARHVPNT